MTKFLLFFTLIASNLTSEDLYKSEVGAYYNFLRNQYTSNFDKIPTVPNCCTDFSGGGGFASNLGLLYNYNLKNNTYLGIRLSLNNFRGDFLEKEKTTLIFDGNKADDYFNHIIDVKTFSLLNIRPEISYKVYKELRVSTGVNFVIPMDAVYHQKEQIDGNRGTFMENGEDTGKRIRNEVEGEFVSPNFNMGLGIRLNYDLPMNKKGTMFLSPEIGYDHYFMDLVENMTWKNEQYFAGISIKILFDKIETIEPVPVVVPKEEPKKEVVYNIKTDLSVFALDSNNNEFNTSDIKIEEFTNLKVYPLLPYVFFEENSSNIDNRYRKLTSSQINNFHTDKFINDSTLGVYYDLLNIVAFRMKNNPNETLRIVGCNSDEGIEKGNLDLSKNRAIEVKKYLMDVWKIEESRLKIESRNLPEKYSNPNTQDGIQENRRVELIPSNNIITKFIIANDTLRKSNFKMIRVYPKISSDLEVKSWELTTSLKNSKIEELSGGKTIEDSYDIDVEDLVNSQNLSNSKFLINLEAEDIKSNSDKISKELPINVLTISNKRQSRLNDLEIANYNLILFDFNKADIKNENDEIIDLIKDNIIEESNILIKGYTDRTGDEALNKELAKNRALSAYNKLDHKNTEYDAIGKSILLFNNDLPEGRMYCRTLIIRTETPVK